MSFRRSQRAPRRTLTYRFGVVLVAALAVASVTAGSSRAWTLNVAQLDNGTCGRNLQIGSDKTSSSSSTPSFLLWGDGGLASYAIFIDGAPIGTFNSDGFGNVCISATVPLADGSHTLTGNELAPHSTYTVTPFAFTVDTAPPAQPSVPVISSYSDSGLVGDHITKYRTPNFSGFADPNVSIQLYSGGSLIGGAKADASGHWSATTSTLSDGSYVITAVALDQAGNKSALSLSCPLTIDSVAPTGALTSPVAGATLAGTVNLSATGNDAVGVWTVDFQVDGVTAGTTSAAPYTYLWNSTAASNGSHTLTALISDYAGNTATSTVTVNVANGTATTPTAPSLTAATGGNNSVSLAWTAPAADGGSAVTGYKVYRGTTSGGATLFTTLGNQTTFTDASAVNGTTYYYQVTAVNAVGESARSNERSATPATPISVPGAPTLNSATGGNGSVSLSWTAPASNGGSAITGYNVYRGTASGNETLLASGLSIVTAYTDATALNGTTYYYQVTALNLAGESARSSERAATPKTVPGAPTLSSATAGTNSVALAWSAPASNGGSAVTGYKIYRGTSSGAETLLTSVGAVTSYTDSAAASGATYFYKVSAVNAVGEGAASNERSATPTAPATAPAAPTLSSATAGNTSVALTWSAPASDGGSAITAYNVYRGTKSGGETLLTTLGAVTSWTDTAAANGTTYFYKVSAVNGVGESVRSNERSATPAAVPGTPTLNSAAAGDKSVTLAWSAPTVVGGSAITAYKVYRGTAAGNGTLVATLGVSTGWTDGTAVNGTTYYYSVTAVNSVGESLPSNERSATPATIPGAATLSSATAGNARVALAWSAPASNGGSAITGYRVYRGTTSGAETLLATVGAVTTWTDGAAANGTTYFYRVSAVNGVGEGSASNERSATPAAPLTPPGAPTLSSATPGSNSVTLAWSAPASNGGSAISGYRVYRGTTSGGETLLASLGAVTSWTDGTAANGTAYFYVVSAVNGVGEGVASGERSATPATVPDAPALSSATPGSNSVALAWSPPVSNGGSTITGYRVYRGTSSGSLAPLVTLGVATSYTDGTAVNGTTYFYKVSAVNGVGEGSASTEQSAAPATPATVPGAPNASATAGDASVAVSWSAPGSDGGSAVTGYRVYRGTASGASTLLVSLGAVTSFTDTAAFNGVTYYYVVRAVNAVGEGGSSPEVAATPRASDATAPSTPTSVKPLVIGTSQVELNWNASTDNVGVTGYRVYRDGSALATVDEPHFFDGGIAAGSSHSYEVYAVDAAGNVSPPSAMLSVRLTSVSTSTTGALAGVVYDGGDRLLAGVVVSIRLSNGTLKSVKTNSSGVWKLSNVQPGAYMVTATLAGYQTQSFAATVVAGQTLLSVATLS